MRPITLLPVLMLLAACNRGDGDDGAMPEPEPVAIEDIEPGQSIIRADVEQPAVVELTEPLSASVSFAEGGYDLERQAKVQLFEVLGTRQMKAGGAIVLGGHSDAAGDDRGNLIASKQRAEAVRDWLTEHGVAETRITTIAFGEQNPLEPNANPDGTPNLPGRAANRRVDIMIALPNDAGGQAGPLDPVGATVEPIAAD